VHRDIEIEFYAIDLATMQFTAVRFRWVVVGMKHVTYTVTCACGCRIPASDVVAPRGS